MDKFGIYKYYNEDGEYPNRKAAHFGFYEMAFEKSYKGKPEDKEEAFKDYMSNLLYEQASDLNMFGTPGVNKSERHKEYIDEYLNPELNIHKY